MIGLLLTSTNEPVQNVIPLKGINAGSDAVGNCKTALNERRQVYQDVGEAVCQASRTPIVGSVVPDFGDVASYGWFGIGIVLQDYLKQAGRAGVMGARAANRGLSVVGNVATAVDLTCRVAP